MKSISLILISIITFFTGNVIAQVNASVESINKSIVSIDDSIANGNYMLFQCEDVEPSEGVPPNLKFYYKGDRLVAIVSQVGHESWSNEFRYYYYGNGVMMKYLKITKGQTDKTERSGIIYSNKGTILWKNTESQTVDGNELQKLFKTFQKYRTELSKY